MDKKNNQNNNDSEENLTLPDTSIPPPNMHIPAGNSNASMSPVPNGMQYSDLYQRNTEKLCHFFTNTGRCNFEERTGRKCKFTHKQQSTPRSYSPSVKMCRFGINCSKPRCSFSHPQLRSPNRSHSRGPFLENIQNQQMYMNPWTPQTAINPWMWGIMNMMHPSLNHVQQNN